MKTLLILLVSISCFINTSVGQIYPVTSYGDITFDFMLTQETPDNLNCQTLVMGNYRITVANSFSNEEVIIVYNNFSQQDTAINTSGVAIFDVATTWSNSSSLFSFVPTPQGNPSAMLFHAIDKIIAHGDTLVLNGQPAIVPITQSPNCTFSQVNGRVYVDNTSNCIYDNGVDNGISSSNIVSVASNYVNGSLSSSLGTIADGSFSNTNFKSDGFVDAYFTVPPVYNFAFTIPACSPVFYHVTALPASGIDFARNCAADIDVSTYVGIDAWPGVRVATPFNLQAKAENFGCQPASGTLALILDPNVTYDAPNSSNPADYTSSSGDTLFWNYVNLTNVGMNTTGYWNQFFGGVRLNPSATINIGDTLVFKTMVTLPANDANPANNSCVIKVPVVNSYDPNIKTVIPAGEGQEGFIPANTSKLTYTVHFQNTGNAEALTVSILDTLDANVLPKTLKILNTSHPMTPQYIAENVVKFTFNNIHLPDSTSDEPNSHGFVTFSVDLQQSLAPLTEIQNKAYIYFDLNPAIITNTALNTIENPLMVQNPSSNNALMVYPNPMTKNTTFFLQETGVTDFLIDIVDITGKKVQQLESNGSSKVVLERENIPSGVYFYQLRTNDLQLVINGKLVIQ